MESRLRQSMEQDQQSDDALYHENRAYESHLAPTMNNPLGGAPLQQTQDYPTSSFAPSFPHSLEQSSKPPTRSTPIAITRPPSEKVEDQSGFETDEDDDGLLDVVERDAIRLRKKFGNNVLKVSSSFQPSVSEEAPSLLSGALLNAPYLGSLSKSESRAGFVPPISLSGPSTRYNYDDESQTEITSYGSLRESQQRGKFLDGPSSYREPHSGQLRRLERNIGQGLSRSYQPSLSIGERIQQNQKRNSTLKQLAKAKNEDAMEASGLALMLGKAATVISSDNHDGEERLEPLIDASRHGMEARPRPLSAFGGEDEEAHVRFDPPTMMSTSMTAFEILASSHNKDTTNSRDLEPKFQPLARSMSDPTPHQLERSPMLSPSFRQMNSPAGSRRASPPVPTTSAEGTIPPGWGTSPFMAGVTVADASLLPCVDVSTSLPLEAQDPDTDAAFDMDME